MGARPMKSASHARRKQNARPSARRTPRAWSLAARRKRRGEKRTPTAREPTPPAARAGPRDRCRAWPRGGSARGGARRPRWDRRARRRRRGRARERARAGARGREERRATAARTEQGEASSAWPRSREPGARGASGNDPHQRGTGPPKRPAKRSAQTRISATPAPPVTTRITRRHAPSSATKAKIAAKRVTTRSAAASG